ncbi:MAG: glucose-1-phosphate cytidylyltransferase [Pseudomonadota bacterium]
MKVVIFAGGFGTRISEESAVTPKPLIDIGGRPILWHIMKLYAAHGLKDFIICCGYKGHLIKQYFADYFIRTADMTFDLGNNDFVAHTSPKEDWRVTCVDTGLHTMTGGRLKRVREYLGGERFCLTYGDGVTDLDINALIAFHEQQGALATLTAVQQPGRFGALKIDGDTITGFREKAFRDGAVINGGFFVVEPSVIDLIDGDDSVWEQAPMDRLVERGKLSAYVHDGFWQNMDTLRDKNLLEDMWASDAPPWKIWDDETGARRDS